MSDKIYVIGHKSPDLDSAAAAISYAKLKNTITETDNYIPAIAGEANKETKYVLEKFGFPMPEKLSSLAHQKIVMVDHNEFSQAADGIAEAEIEEILDHHKLEFSYKDPITVTIKPWGSSCTLIAREYMNRAIAIDKNLAGLMLSAILVDTVIAKSPTCTEVDKSAIDSLSGLAEIDDWQAFGMEIFKVRSDISDYKDEDIIKSDFKDFLIGDKKIGIGQVETADLKQFEAREDGILVEMERIFKKEEYHSVVIFLTDIINLGSKFLVISREPEKVELALDAKLQNKRVYVPGIISRKKQVAPKFIEIFEE
jgi:manganese-dependent inorganic pyrophosphatase